jgi:alkylation response protein AidB-like acyl-CoA dehydrogenase
VAPVPLVPTALAAALIAHAGSGRQRDRWLPGLASGETPGAVGPPELVPGGADAAALVLVDDAGARVLAREDADIRPTRSIDSTRAAAAVAGAGEPLEGDLPAGVDRALVALAAELVGVCDRALEMTTAYVKERRQLGVPVGAYQAVSHKCPQMLLDTEQARSAVALAASASPGRRTSTGSTSARS